jgi:hypothetical protein
MHLADSRVAVAALGGGILFVGDGIATFSKYA